jgi:hypothetical protein
MIEEREKNVFNLWSKHLKRRIREYRERRIEYLKEFVFEDEELLKQF